MSEACILILALPLMSCGSEQGSYPGLCVALSLCHPGDKGWGSPPPSLRTELGESEVALSP